MTDQVTLIHNSPLGQLEIPGVGNLDPGEPFTVSAERADILLRQNELFRPAVSPYDDLKVGELKQLAADRGIEVDGVKADIVSALAFADQPPIVVTTEEPVVDAATEIAQPEEIQE